MNRPLPSSAGAGLAAFGPKIAQALFLRASFYREAAADADSWRGAAAMVALSAIASDTVRYSDLGHFLTLALGNWVFLAIMLLALLRWSFVVAAAAVPVRLLGGRAELAVLLRCLGLAHAPLLLLATPALLYAFGLGATVSPAFFLLLLSLVSVWTIAAFTVATTAATGLSLARALPIGLAAHFALLLFNLLADAALYASYTQ